MRHRVPPRRALLAALVLACAAVVLPALPPAAVPPASAAVTTQTPVMGPPLLNAQQLAAWYWRHHGSIQPHIPIFNDNITQLAQTFIDDGRIEGVRGDIAFVPGEHDALRQGVGDDDQMLRRNCFE